MHARGLPAYLLDESLCGKDAGVIRRLALQELVRNFPGPLLCSWVWAPAARLAVRSDRCDAARGVQVPCRGTADGGGVARCEACVSPHRSLDIVEQFGQLLGVCWSGLHAFADGDHIIDRRHRAAVSLHRGGDWQRAPVGWLYPYSTRLSDETAVHGRNTGIPLWRWCHGPAFGVVEWIWARFAGAQ